MTTTSSLVEFYYDLHCPWTYIAACRVEAMAARTNAKLIWAPVQLSILRQPRPTQGDGKPSRGDKLKAEASKRDLLLTIEKYQIPFQSRPSFAVDTTNALLLLWTLPQEQRGRLSQLLFKAYWVDHLDIGQPKILKQLATKIGIAYEQSMDLLSKARQQLDEATKQCAERGAPGVPSFWVTTTATAADASEGTLYWGQDRMHFVEAQLLAVKRQASWSQIPELAIIEPRCRKDVSTQPKTLRFWFDFSSFWSFIGWTQIKRIVDEAGPQCRLELKPALLGALFRDNGQVSVAIDALAPRHRDYMMKDASEWMAWWNARSNQDMKLVWPDHFPLRTVTALRIVALEPAATDAIFKASWLHNINIGDSKELANVLNKAGFDGEALLKDVTANRNGCKDQVNQNFSEAINIGLFGMPSFQVNQGHAIFGQDRLFTVQDLLAGWKPTLLPPAEGEKRVDRSSHV